MTVFFLRILDIIREVVAIIKTATIFQYNVVYTYQVETHFILMISL